MKRMKLTEQEYNQAVNRAFMEGYEKLLTSEEFDSSLVTE